MDCSSNSSPSEPIKTARGPDDSANSNRLEEGPVAVLTNLKSDGNSSDLGGSKSQQELQTIMRSQEEEVQLLRKQITNAYVRELQLKNEKYSLEKKFSELRMAIDEKQREAVRSALDELVSRKGYLEENLKLTRELKAVEGELYLYVSSILGLLAEYDVCPPVVNASAICYSLKRIHDDLHWKIRTFDDSIKKITIVSEHQARSEHDGGDKNAVNILTSPNPPDYPNTGPFSDVVSHRSNFIERVGSSMNFSFGPERAVSETDQDRFHVIGNHTNNMGSSPYEETPGIEEFQIIGLPIPGEQLLGCGYPVHGTSLCVFQWVRHLEDGTSQYIEGATNPVYVVTADDVDKLIAVECIPLDNQSREGELVTLFANNKNKIQCEPEMQFEIDRYISIGEASFSIQMLKDAPDNWEPSTLFLKRSHFEIRSTTNDVLLIAEKFSDDFSIKIPLGFKAQLVLMSSNGYSYPLSAQNVRERDILVLTMRYFQNKAWDKGKKAL